MSGERKTLVAIREEIDELRNPDDRQDVRKFARQLRAIVHRGGPLAEIALALCAAELWAQDDEVIGDYLE